MEDVPWWRHADDKRKTEPSRPIGEVAHAGCLAVAKKLHVWQRRTLARIKVLFSITLGDSVSERGFGAHEHQCSLYF
jgi:hypothetical protein